MKFSVNLIVTTDAYDDPDMLLDTIVGALEAEGCQVPWSKSKEVE